MRRHWAALAAAGLLAGCGNDPDRVPLFSPKATVLAQLMKKSVDVHSTGEAAGTLHEAERMWKSGELEMSDYETLRRIEAALRANNRNQAVRIYETAAGQRAHAAETPEEKAAVEKAKAADTKANTALPRNPAAAETNYGSGYPGADAHAGKSGGEKAPAPSPPAKK